MEISQILLQAYGSKLNAELALFFQIIIFVILPVTLIYIKVIPIRLRLLVLIWGSLVVWLYVIYERLTFFQLGIRTDNLVSSVIPYLMFVVCSLSLIVILAKIFGNKIDKIWWKNKSYIWIILISLTQQYIFFAYFLIKFQAIYGSFIIAVLLNSIGFAYIHILYPPVKKSFLLGYISGIAFGSIYLFYPDLILSTISQIILSMAAAYLSFFPVEI